jgi:hypothetical protein
MNIPSSAHPGTAALGPLVGTASLSSPAIDPSVRRWALAGLAALAVACGAFVVSPSPRQGARPQAATASIQYARVSGHFRNTDVKTIFGALATQVQAGLAVDAGLAGTIDTFDADGERLADVMNDLCTISACDWSVEAGSPPTLTIRQRAKASE